MKNEIDKSILERNNITIKKGFNKKAVALIMLAAAITVTAKPMSDTSKNAHPATWNHIADNRHHMDDKT